MASDKELEQELAEMAQTLERLRVHYQSYFMGLEKLPPNVMREQLERRVRHTELNDVRRANLKFRWNSLVQKYRTYDVYWDRVMREIEEGRFDRDMFARSRGMAPGDEPEGKAARRRTHRLRAEAAPMTPRPQSAGPEPEPAPGPSLERPAHAEPPPPAADVDADLFRAYLKARLEVGMGVEGITESAFKAGLEKQRRIQKDRLGTEAVRFEVSVKDGKVVLLARRV